MCRDSFFRGVLVHAIALTFVGDARWCSVRSAYVSGMDNVPKRRGCGIIHRQLVSHSGTAIELRRQAAARFRLTPDSHSSSSTSCLPHLCRVSKTSPSLTPPFAFRTHIVFDFLPCVRPILISVKGGIDTNMFLQLTASGVVGYFRSNFDFPCSSPCT
jgi:hypothetical protein